MKYAIIYDSKSGNTQLLAETIKESLIDDECIYFGLGNDFDPQACDLIFLGSWCDKGTLSNDIKPALTKLDNKVIALFATCGFGDSEQYFNSVASRMISELPKSCNIIHTILTQGKMPMRIRKRYEGMLKDEKMKVQAQSFIENFDCALKHPDAKDLSNVRKFAAESISKAKVLYGNK